MRLTLWMMTTCGALLLAGCVAPAAKPIYFGSQATVDWLMINDPDLVRQIVAHNRAQ